jgi:orotidine-5'-phosphate decarboxylase
LIGTDRDEILRLAETLDGVVGMLKIGLQAFIVNGPALVRELVSSCSCIFLDLKINDTPNTAQRALTEVASLGAVMTTVHTSGGAPMLRACATDATFSPWRYDPDQPRR